MDGTLEDMCRLAAEHGTTTTGQSGQSDESLERIVAALYQKLDIV